MAGRINHAAALAFLTAAIFIAASALGQAQATQPTTRTSEPAPARRIVYVCDASESMLGMFDSVRMGTRGAIERLKPIQCFNVIFFCERDASAVDKHLLLPATPENKRRAFKFLDEAPMGGRTRPMAGLELAFRQKPDLIYLFTDGDFADPGNKGVVEYCRKMAADGKVRINTVAFIERAYNEDPFQLAFVRALHDIARDSGGRLTCVSSGDDAEQWFLDWTSTKESRPRQRDR